jgi:hypothetical protein
MTLAPFKIWLCATEVLAAHGAEAYPASLAHVGGWVEHRAQEAE